MSFDNIVKNDYGQVAQVTIIDTDTDAAADISGYSTTIQMVFTAPDGTETEKTATFVTDGTDGVIQYTIENGLIDASGKWAVRGRVAGTSSRLSSVRHYFTVYD